MEEITPQEEPDATKLPVEAAASQEPTSQAEQPETPEPSLPTFDPSLPAKAAIHFEYDQRVNFAMQQNDVPIVKRLSIENLTDEDLTDVIVGVWIDCHLAPVWQREISRIGPRATYNLDHVDLALDASVLVHQVEREVAHLTGELTQGERIIAQVKLPIEVLAYNEWGGVGSLPEIMAAFVMPNHPAIDSLLSSARKHLENKGHPPSFSGYQSHNPDHVRAMVEAIYDALIEADIGYIAPPASYETQGQKVRSPEQLLEHRLATCLDLALLLAACVEAAGLHALVIMIQGHAFMGVWTSDESFAEPATDDASRIRKRVQLGEIIAIEATAITTRPAMTMRDAEKAALRHLLEEKTFHCAIDVRCARKLRIRPLPLRVAAGTFTVSEGAVADGTQSGSDATPWASNDAAAISAVDAAGLLEAPAAEPEEIEEPNARLDRWKRKLLDLSGRNRLINFRESNKSIPLVCPDLAVLEDVLSGGMQFNIHSRPKLMDEASPRSAEAAEQRTGQNVLEQFLRDELGSRRLYSSLGEELLDRRLLEIYRAARSSVEESGANTLYLAVGFLAWYESNAASAPRRLAPILLLPLSLDRDSVREPFRISLGDDEPRINVTLLEKLRTEFGVDITGLDEAIEDESGLDIPQIFQRFRKAIRDIPRWDIVEESHIGLFSFTKFLMWLDLQERSKTLMRNPVVKYLVERPTASFDGDEPMPAAAALDDTRHPKDTFCPLDADSSQLAAVFAAQDGRSFVLEGPPGTGKSQTITNLIAQCLTHGKRVLFVAEKMAALSVVQRRLTKIGLGPFCLELHSNKSSKREVLDQLSAAMDVEKAALPQNWESHSNELAGSRSELNALVRTLHEPRPIGRSVYQMTSQLIGLRAVDRIRFDDGWIKTLDGDKIDSIHETIEQLATAGATIGDIAAHPYRAAEREQWQMTLPEQVVSCASELHRQMDAYENAVGEAQQALQLPGGSVASELSKVGLSWLDELAQMLLESPRPTEAMLTEPSWPDLKAALFAAIKRGQLRDELRKQMHARYRESILAQNLEDLIVRVRSARESFVLVRWFKRRGIRKLIAPHAVSTLPVDDGVLIAELEQAIKLRDENRALGDTNSAAARALGALWNDGEADWARIEAAVAWCDRFRAMLLKPGAKDFESEGKLRGRCAALATTERDGCAEGAAIGDKLRSMIAVDRAFKESRKAMVALLVVNEPLAWGDDAAPGHLKLMRDTAENWKISTRLLPDWCHWRRSRHAAIDAQLAPLVEGYEAGKWPGDSLAQVFDRSIGQQWLGGVIDSSDSLHCFNSKEQERKIARFARLDRDQLDLTSQYLRAKFSANVPKVHGEASGASEMGILQRQLKLQRRHMPVRKLIQKLPNLLPRLKPCLLMSPLSVAQYLDASYPPFDVVVFDEASQIPVWDAVGAIARGTQVIVVGDSKQLPPTNFFMKADDEQVLPDEDDFEEMESILDECSASGLRSLRLLWHYRSRHESLITFSNYHYYDNRLQTFPSPAERSDNRGVSMRYLPEGVYDRGDTRTNPAEAQAIVAEIVRRLMSKTAEATSTIGVVTFSIPQQVLIEDLLDEAKRKHPEIEPYFNDAQGESVFVKNLENVQGDERDVILFSICYGPDKDGKVAMAFGPLNRQGGERRLNVAITRAREQVIVFSTLRGDQIDLSRTSSIAVKHLKSFLEYAQRGPDAIAEAVTLSDMRGGDDSFERDVCEQLRQRGWQVEMHVGCSGFRIDMAVRHLDDAETFVLGILCDGPFYAKAETARDRDRNRQTVLEQLGWTLVRLWSSDWWMDPERELGRLEKAIRAAHEARNVVCADDATPQAAQEVKVAAGQEAIVELEEAQDIEDEEDAPPGMQTYKLTPVKLYGDAESFYESKSRRQIRDVLLRIVKREAPILVDVMLKRIVGCWGFARVTSRAQSHIEEILAVLPEGERPSVVEGVMWKSEQKPAEYASFRVPGEEDEQPRKAEEIPAIEYANAAQMVVIQQIGLPMEALVRETAKLFGFSRVTTKVQAGVDAGIALLLSSGKCVEKDGLVTAAKE